MNKTKRCLIANFATVPKFESRTQEQSPSTELTIRESTGSPVSIHVKSWAKSLSLLGQHAALFNRSSQSSSVAFSRTGMTCFSQVILY
ncbi:hypothetical protein FC759_26480 [Citrobacter freundii]|nr:hypothetical protein E0F20_26945 [Citrobacter freundii]TBV85382.1 hypothetical protein E0E99_26700 [Citrobacter freundii]TKI71453.1 hypothetical protein FC759_26480 [Citrobacter freundii]